MTQVVTLEGQRAMLRTVTMMKMVLHLYTNDHTPDASDMLSNYREMSGFGYKAQDISRSWTIDPTGVAKASHTPITFHFAGSAGPVYGYFVTSNGTLLFAERFSPREFNVNNEDDRIMVTLNMILAPAF